jgi:hypothetical protein
LKLEIDGNDYQHEPQANNQTARSPFNFGAVYRYSPNVDFSFGVERGNTVMASFTLHAGLNTLGTPKFLDSTPPPVRPYTPAQLPAGGWGDTAVHLQERGLPMTQVDIDRSEWVALHTRAEPPSQRLPAQRVSQGHAITILPTDSGEEGGTWTGNPAGFSGDWGPSYSQILGGPNSFVLYQMGLQATMEQRFSDRPWLSGAFNLRLLDNYTNFVYDAPSDLPRVRTNQREYVTTSAANIVWTPLTGDGGARLNRRFTLNDITRQRDYRALGWRSVRPSGARSAEDTSYVLADVPAST